MGSCHSKGSRTYVTNGRNADGNASSLNIKEGGGFQYTYKGKTYTIMQENGYAYDVSDLADIPERIGNGISASEFAKRAANNGYELSPAQMRQREAERNAERKQRDNIDYELGMGVPWGNSRNRKVARRNRMVSRSQKKLRSSSRK